MPKTTLAKPNEVLLAELNAAIPARKSALEFERRYSAGDDGERIQRGLFEIRVAEARLADAGAAPEAAEALGRLALAEAEALEDTAAVLAPLLAPGPKGHRIGLLRLAAALLHWARLGEGRSRTYFTFARRGKHLPGFRDVLELAPENELFFLAQRRFQELLQAGGAWSGQDADWLRLRCGSLPGRFRLAAAELRSWAWSGAKVPLPEGLERLRQPFLDYGYDAAPALDWAVAGFTLNEAMVWGRAGLAQPQQAQAWRDWGLGPEEAGAWVAADLLPDEAAAFKACGAADPRTASSLRNALGDVEYLLNWFRAGFDANEVLVLRTQGVRSLDEAVGRRASLKFTAPKQSVGLTTAWAPGPPQVPPAAPPAPPPRQISAPIASPAALPRPAAPPPAPPPPSNVPPQPVQAPGPTLPPLVITRSALPNLGSAPPGEGVSPAPPSITRSALPLEPAWRPPVAAASPPPVAPVEVDSAVAESPTWAQERAQALFGIDVDDAETALSVAPSQGGAWMGWGLLEAEPDRAVRGTAEAPRLVLGGWNLHVLAASEGVALPGRPFDPPRLAPKEDWQPRLDALRAAQGGASWPGEWYLHAWAPARAWLFWGLVFKTAATPWGDAIDFDAQETWLQRWARRAKEAGEPGKPCPCALGRTEGGGRWIAIRETILGSTGLVPLAFQPRALSKAWVRGMEDFCEKMGIKARSATWHLLAGSPADPEHWQL